MPFQAGRVGGRRPGRPAPRPGPAAEAVAGQARLGRAGPAAAQPPAGPARGRRDHRPRRAGRGHPRGQRPAGHPAQHSPCALRPVLLADLPDLAAAHRARPRRTRPARTPAGAVRARGPARPSRPAGGAHRLRHVRPPVHRRAPRAPAAPRRCARSPASLARYTSCADVHLFGIDCGNGALLPMTRLPHCGAVVQRTQTERAARLLTRLAGRGDPPPGTARQRRVADITEQRAGGARRTGCRTCWCCSTAGRASPPRSARSTAARSPTRCG